MFCGTLGDFMFAKRSAGKNTAAERLEVQKLNSMIKWNA